MNAREPYKLEIELTFFKHGYETKSTHVAFTHNLETLGPALDRAISEMVCRHETYDPSGTPDLQPYRVVITTSPNLIRG